MFQTKDPTLSLPGTATPLVVALPGAGCSPAIYAGVRLDGWLVHPLDWSNSEGSVEPSAVARRLADAVANRKGPTALAGHSTGGAIAVLTAALAGDRVSHLVVSNTGVHSRNHGDPTLPARIRAQWVSTEQQRFLRACFLQQPAPALWKELCDYLARLRPEVLLQSVEGLRSLDLGDALARVTCRTLIAHGRLDERRHVSDAQALVAGVSDATLSLLPGGHTPMVDCTAEYNAAVEAFLQSTTQIAQETP